ncbi:MAG: hypothetical protein L0Y66_24030 [Myxococcaceae bacterium]|nr:hypothetical protein [Myxococcaceae bacterium]MCI0673421.1 hypothetical protein [Myxococcaceae bacterium]
MAKVTGVMVTMALLASGIMGVLESSIGPYAEGVAVALMGAGLLFFGGVLRSRRVRRHAEQESLAHQE